VVDRATAFQSAALAPRWLAAGVQAVHATVRYPASQGYLAYAFQHQQARRRIAITVTGGGMGVACNVLLPAQATAVRQVTVDGEVVPCRLRTVRSSRYAEFAIELGRVRELVVSYR